MPSSHLILCRPRRDKSEFERVSQLIWMHDSNHHCLVFLPQVPRAQWQMCVRSLLHHQVPAWSAMTSVLQPSCTWESPLKAFRISPMPHLPTAAPESLGKGPGQKYLLDVSLCFSTRWPQRYLLTWKSSACMTPTPTTASWWLRGTLRSVHLSEGECVWMMPCQDLLLHSSTGFVKTVTFFFSWLIYVMVGKQPPEQAVPPLGTININMCAGPSAPASLWVNEA